MRFSRIEVHIAGTLKVTLNLAELQHKTPYMIKAMTGLDIPEMYSRFYGYSSEVGEDGRRVPYFEPVLPPREIALRLGYRPNYANYTNRSNLRDELYRLLGGTRLNRVELHFFNEAQELMWITGAISKIETALFTEESEAVMTFKCDESLFQAPTELIFASPTVTNPTPWRAVRLFDADSTFQHGARFEFTIATNTDALWIETVQPDNTSLFKLDVSSGYVLNGNPKTEFASGDVVIVDSSSKLLSVKVVSGAYEANLVDKVMVNSVWPVVHHGENNFQFQALLNESPVTNPTLAKVSWYARFAGV